MKNIKSNYDLQVDSARKIFLTYDQDFIIQKYRLQADDIWMYLQYLNTAYRINRNTGEIEECIFNEWKTFNEFNTVMTIYDLLCFSESENIPTLLGEWCTIGSFVITGVKETGPYTQKYANFFDDHLIELKEACQSMGGIIEPKMAGADVTCKIHVTPFLPVLLQFWQGDEDFEPKVVIMWDKNTDKFLRFETTFYLQKDLLERLKNKIVTK